MKLTYDELFSQFVMKRLDTITLSDLMVPIDGEYQIDVVSICNKFNLKIEYGDYPYSGQCYKDNNTIFVNKFEAPVRQRFTIAHELGHYVLNHSGKPFRISDPNKYLINQHIERLANKFAAELLMPRKLMIHLLLKHIESNNWDSNELTDRQIDQLTKQVAIDLNVSKEALTYRIANERIFN
ncbi:ImmA/IrrE family metallo-endopeptidase [Macrococcus armenti]|uniref:ImmA/IrrE family metallo-endopeptidase n=1 Tax=Macrococcus armenti TaxID=2875764 RepID=UPI001CCDE093|nr:ImmA/IrrE family metallo-endopeptidase [Macrococcus armenti]UBH15778.1 ImmA/IrrE family metallo-endopeptidase [Macrococcus armenti]UBH18137.1 ImmA/IrrE family metallo-endopeptidase [Macrococcus armenti]UBH20404.1 ImmA/IrrE family metallo-endopeptidase [Macrococcus armenti]